MAVMRYSAPLIIFLLAYITKFKLVDFFHKKNVETLEPK